MTTKEKNKFVTIFSVVLSIAFMIHYVLLMLFVKNQDALSIIGWLVPLLYGIVIIGVNTIALFILPENEDIDDDDDEEEE